MRTLISLAALALALTGISGSAATASRSSTQYLSLAQQGVAAAHTYWWSSSRGWYLDTIDDSSPMPLARLWSAYPMFEAVDAVAVAQPTAANKAAVRAFVAGAERYWNPDVGGYAYYPGERGPNKMTFFDDNGWWGLAFMDAYRATHDHRDVVDAARAFRFIYGQGWDGHGVWWDTRHHKRTSEPLAAGILLGVQLYEATHRSGYLTAAKKMLAWANAHSWNKQRGLYQRNATDGTVMDYVEGIMAAANAELCQATKVQGYCAKAEAVGKASLAAFPSPLDWGPQYDTIYLRWMLDVYSITHDTTWLTLAQQNANRAAASAADSRHLYVLGWDGRSPYEHQAQPNMLELHAATTSLFGWLATVS
jgi:uncharacterized protein YyaL (SSP411 family)